MRGRTWLVTDGLLDPPLRLAALRRGQALNLINLATERQPASIRRLRQALISDPAFAGRVASYHNAANLGGAAFLQEWLASDTGAVSRLAFYVSPDLISEAGFAPQTDRLLFVAAREAEIRKDRPVLDEHDAFWTRMDLLLQGSTAGDPIDALRGTLRRHVSMAANNLGVQLEDWGRPEEAYAAYRRALAFDPDNFSAMLNRVVLTRRGIAPEDQPAAENAAAAAFATLKNRPEAGRLARWYGYVRVPGEFAKQSAEWMRFGQPKMATATLRRALELAPEEQKLSLLNELAGLCLSDGNLSESEALFKRVLAQAPSDIPALLGLARVALHRADAAAARAYLDRAKQAGLADTAYRLEEAGVELAAGEAATARHTLQDLTDHDPKLLLAWALQASLLIKQGKTAEVERDILPRMRSATGNAPHYLIALTQGFVLQEKGPAAYGKAREHFMLAYKLNPGNRSVLNALLTLDVALKDAAAAERHAAALLRMDRDDGLANYLMGTLLLSRDDLAGAEAHLRRSLAAKPSAPVCNDLAETLRRQGKLDEAEKTVRQALALDSQNACAHDTLACVLLDAGRLPEAQQAAAAARALDPKAAAFKLTDVRLLARTGDPAEAREAVRQLARHVESLSPRQRAELAAVEAELKKR
jgi:tetratricopeptide (TPR) repeat protein